MDLLKEVEFPSACVPGATIRLRRISLAQRLRFLAANFDLMQRLRFAGAQCRQSEQAEAEIELSRRILRATVLEIRVVGGTAGAGDVSDWLVTEAPSDLCVEVLKLAGEEMVLGEAKRKN